MMKKLREGGQLRHLLKTISWRFIATGTTFLLAWLFTDDLKVATAIGSTEAAAKMFLYYAHERIWFKYVNFDRGSKVE
ncbi:MAG: DUF2061 domain-containing protein [Candidatus Saccharimonadales bacterium]|nr:DUF2061 domain-containing protein [Candidatus Saccharimonadales bacterium]